PLCCSISVLFLSPRPPTSTPFPYTTLFRSKTEVPLTGVLGRILKIKGSLVEAISATILRKRHHLGIFIHKLKKHAMGLPGFFGRSEEHTSELQSRENLVCRLLLEKKNNDGH